MNLSWWNLSPHQAGLGGKLGRVKEAVSHGVPPWLLLHPCWPGGDRLMGPEHSARLQDWRKETAHPPFDVTVEA